ncbi:acylphosphatase [Phorcysia thermohydrogeniphila]|uniref:acylphosphatase n=1 Tax=Phorcysia thermohydrogeniphila TaxID=936138 RepID=A0A4R1GAC2_9BACT|nr:acylphosphatase [Phorcysia thermohydrogeniphila]TCK03395.1 acylphosphatase [Phorcysia thermohydrogeniphila]
MKGLHAFVSGRVQGVGYRAFTRNKAKLLGLKGFVRNLPDGRVEVYAEGEEGALEELLNYLRKGPILARVDSIEYEFVEPRGEYEDFVVLC